MAPGLEVGKRFNVDRCLSTGWTGVPNSILLVQRMPVGFGRCVARLLGFNRAVGARLEGEVGVRVKSRLPLGIKDMRLLVGVVRAHAGNTSRCGKAMRGRGAAGGAVRPAGGARGCARGRRGLRCPWAPRGWLLVSSGTSAVGKGVAKRGTMFR